MLHIETKGSWYDMGRQLGSKFSDELGRCIDRFVGLMKSRGRDLGPAISRVRADVQSRCPELLEETAGMAEGSGIEEIEVFSLRFYGNLAMEIGCASFYVQDESGEAWLGRTVDIEPEDHWQMICQVHRPADGCAMLTTSYLGMPGPTGVNEHGLAFGSASAQTRDTYGDTGVFSSLVGFRAMRDCSSVKEAVRLLTAEPILGKGAVMLVADASGASCLLPVVPGRKVEPIPRKPDMRWQACTNFQPSRDVPDREIPGGLYNPYARYGWMAHQLGDDQAPATRAGAEKVVRGLAQPGTVVPKGAVTLPTGYSTLIELRSLSFYLAPGNPNQVQFEKVEFP